MYKHLLSTILHQLQIPHTSQYVDKVVKGVPYSHSMYGLGLALSRFNVLTDSIRFTDKNAICQEHVPCVVLYNGEFVMISNVTSQLIEVKKANGKSLKVDRKQFEHDWDGASLLIKKSNTSKESNYRSHKNDEIKNRIVTIGVMITIIALFILFSVLNPHHVYFGWWSLIAINVIGILLSILLLQKDLNIHSTLTEKICGFTKNGNCSEVTNSSGAKIFGLFKLSEIGFAFFLVNTVFVVSTKQSLAPLAIISYLVLPFSFWSVWYQKFKAKSWCTLCLGVLTVMWIQAAIYCFSGILENYDISWISAISVLLSYGLVFFVTNISMDILHKKEQAEHMNAEYMNVKYSTEVMTRLLNSQKVVTTDTDSCSELVFGNPDAPIEITVFSNPYCSPCAEMHKRISDIPGDIAKVRYVMTFFAHNLSVINRKIIAAYQQLGPEATWELLTKWYATGKQQGVEFFDQLELDSESESVLQEFNKHQNWAKQNPTGGTPTVLINGVELIPPYRVEDYKIVYDVL